MVGRGGGSGRGAAGWGPGAAVALLVLDESQDVGEREGLAALAARQEVTVLAEGRDPWWRWRWERRRRRRRESSLVTFSI